jgi:hypothetical protein
VTGDELVDVVDAVGAERLFVARALESSIRRSLEEAFDATELPFVRGRTVVPADLGERDVVVAGHPNHLGVFDLPGERWLAVTGVWSALRDPAGAVGTVAMHPPADRDAADETLGAARVLAKRAGQLPGVTVAFPVESPVFVVLLDIDPAPVAASVAGWSALGELDELPGGLRIEVQTLDVERYASAMERAIAEER